MFVSSSAPSQARPATLYFTSCNFPMQELLLAKRDLKLSRVVKRLDGFEVVLIDDLGYVQQSREEMERLRPFQTSRPCPTLKAAGLSRLRTRFAVHQNGAKKN